jgi:hypothetical protein
MTEPPSINPVRLMIGNAVIGMGILWMALSGLCSAWMMGEFLFQDPSFQDFLSSLWLVLLVGGISAGLGYIAIVIGRVIRGRK